MAKKDNVHLQLSEELAGIDAELDEAMEALSETNHRINSFLNGEEVESDAPKVPAAEMDDEQDSSTVEAQDFKEEEPVDATTAQED